MSPKYLVRSLAAKTFVMLIGLSIFFVNNAQAENWTRFRGPNGTGMAKGVEFPATWTEQDYLWKKSLPGIGHSSPVGWENRIFVTSGNVETGSVTLHCLAANSGEQLWQREFVGQRHRMHASNSYASTTPTVDQKQVYLSWASAGKMRCVALTHQGEEVWRTELGDFAGPHGFAASPIVVGGRVCMQVDHAEGGFLVGIDSISGDVRWRAERPGGKASYATPCTVQTVDDGVAVVSQSMTGGMQALEVQTGKQLWQIPDAFPARTVSSPFWANQMILGVCGGGGSGKSLVGVTLNAGAEPVVKLALTKQLPYVPTPVAKGRWLFLWHDQGRVSCVDMQSEQPSKLLWTKRIGGKFSGSPILAGGKIYCLSMEGKAVVIAAGQEFALLGETDLGQPTNATPAIHDSKMYLRTESSLACLPAKS